MLTQMVDWLIQQDPALLAQRTSDTRRYIVEQWCRTHDDPIDEDEVALFLCDERRSALTEDQKLFAKEKRAEMLDCYRTAVLRIFLCGEMMRLHMASGPEDFLRVLSPTGELLTAS